MSRSIVWLLFFAGLISLGSFAFSAQRPTVASKAPNAKAPDAMDAYLKKLAGRDAVVCPRVSRGQDFKAANACALKASAARKHFYVRYDMEVTKDHIISIGMVGAADGKSYMVAYNSAGVKVKNGKKTFTPMEIRMISMPGSKHPFKGNLNTNPAKCLVCHRDTVRDNRIARSTCFGPMYVGKKSGRVVCSNPPTWGIKPGCGGSCHKGQVQQQ